MSHHAWLIYYFEMESCSVAQVGVSAVAKFQLIATSASWVQAILLPQPPKWLGLQACGTLLANFLYF